MNEGLIIKNHMLYNHQWSAYFQCIAEVCELRHVHRFIPVAKTRINTKIVHKQQVFGVTNIKEISRTQALCSQSVSWYFHDISDTSNTSTGFSYAKHGLNGCLKLSQAYLNNKNTINGKRWLSNLCPRFSEQSVDWNNHSADAVPLIIQTQKGPVNEDPLYHCFCSHSFQTLFHVCLIRGLATDSCPHRHSLLSNTFLSFTTAQWDNFLWNWNALHVFCVF